MQETIIGRTVPKTLNQPEKTLELTVNGQAQSVVATPIRRFCMCFAASCT